MPRLILASTSPRRRELLTALGLPFEVVPPAVEESRQTLFASREAVVEWVRETARAKAFEVARRSPPGHWVLGADTIVVLGCEVLHKPLDEADAVAMLDRLQGQTHTVMTAIRLCPGGGGTEADEVVQTAVTFYPADRATLEAYVAAGESLDKAGGYAAQGRGALIIERIDGCYFNVVGLPIATLSRLLARVGFDLWAAESDRREAAQ